MADITHTNTATERRASSGIVAGKGDAHNLKVLVSTVELTSSSVGTTVLFGKIPSDARISGRSRLYWDDLATTGSPTMDVGLASVDANITSDPDAIGNGFGLSSADAEGAVLVSDIANIGLPAWDFVNAQTADPKGALEVYGSIADAATTDTGTVTLELLYYID
jgi:hypothetical protein